MACRCSSLKAICQAEWRAPQPITTALCTNSGEAGLAGVVGVCVGGSMEYVLLVSVECGGRRVESVGGKCAFSLSSASRVSNIHSRACIPPEISNKQSKQRHCNYGNNNCTNLLRNDQIQLKSLRRSIKSCTAKEIISHP